MLSFSIIQRAINSKEESVEGGKTETGAPSSKKGKYVWIHEIQKISINQEADFVRETNCPSSS